MTSTQIRPAAGLRINPFRALCFFAVAGSGILSGANLIVNPSFETPLVTAASNCGSPFDNRGDCMNVSSNTAGFGWTVLGNSGNGFLNLINSNYNEDWGSPGILRFNPQSGNQSIDLTGTGNQGDNGLQQTVATTVGVTYDLSFYLGHADDHYTVSYSGPAVIKLSINGLDAGVFSNSVDTLNQVNWALQTYSFVASSNSTRISFLSGTNVNFAGLDTVSLTAESPRVPVISNPEPGTFGLMGAGLGLAALLARKLRRPRVE